jgi:hypothetical protein
LIEENVTAVFHESTEPEDVGWHIKSLHTPPNTTGRRSSVGITIRQTCVWIGWSAFSTRISKETVRLNEIPLLLAVAITAIECAVLSIVSGSEAIAHAVANIAWFQHTASLCDQETEGQVFILFIPAVGRLIAQSRPGNILSVVAGVGQSRLGHTRAVVAR